VSLWLTHVLNEQKCGGYRRGAFLPAKVKLKTKFSSGKKEAWPSIDRGTAGIA